MISLAPPRRVHSGAQKQSAWTRTVPTGARHDAALFRTGRDVDAVESHKVDARIGRARPNVRVAPLHAGRPAIGHCGPATARPPYERPALRTDPARPARGTT